MVLDKAHSIYTKDEVSKHTKENDLWLIIDDDVYDCSNFVEKHPGGRIIVMYGGLDATDVFQAMHPKFAKSFLPQYKIGTLCEKDRAKPQLIKDYRALRKQIEDEGLFESNVLFYIRLLAINWAMFITSMYLLYNYPESNISLFCSAVLLALFWQQNGWLSHDFLHYSVFKNRLQNWVVPYIMGGMMSGYTYVWWSRKHNAHHAAPNVVSDVTDLGDPDIKTLPVLSWTPRDPRLKKVFESTIHKTYIKYQSWFFFPILLFARLNWNVISTSKTIKEKSGWFYAELPSVIFYWIWSISVPIYLLGVSRGLGFYIFAQALSGAFLAGPFVVNHNGTEIFEHSDLSDNIDFFRLQALTARNINPNWFTNWFMGGLNFQIEHHIYPRCPRHSYPRVQQLVREFCRKNNIKYHITDAYTGIYEVISVLYSVGNGKHAKAN